MQSANKEACALIWSHWRGGEVLHDLPAELKPATREAGYAIQANFEVYSAGTRPSSTLNPFALEVLEQKGHDVTVLRAKDISEFQTPDAPKFDFVFTVCNRAANEDCPAWAGQPVSAHWGMPDPVLTDGTRAQKSLAFQQAYGALRNRITSFAALPIESLDRISLQRALDHIGQAHSGEPA